KALSLVFTPHVESREKKGDVTSFAALCTALAATIGTGNIVGVATAVSIGGPGALFWMFVAAFFGMATKYAECLLAVRFREVDKNGRFVGGPMYYIKNGIGSRYGRTAKVLAIMFSVFGLLAACLGIGTYTQINSVVEAAAQLHVDRVVASVVVTVMVAIITYGGLKFISNTAKNVVPFMALLYIICCLCVVAMNFSQVPDAIVLIVKSAFTPTSAVGGFAGATVLMALQKGVARGIFSNEAGLGSAPLAAASAKTNSPAEQGLISMTGTFIDTMIICMLTGLTLILTGAWCSDTTGVAMTTLAFSKVLGSSAGTYIISISLIMFAFTTIIGWNFYAERCVIHLFGVKGIKPFRIIYVLIVASYILLVMFIDMSDVTQKTAVNTVWTIADISNGLMAFPNLIALFMLRRVIWDETRKYLAGLKKKSGNSSDGSQDSSTLYWNDKEE
ncbi:MAG: alanine/glycine:cation symporter family protein, partial [Succinivibrionaceae bacterium]